MRLAVLFTLVACGASAALLWSRTHFTQSIEAFGPATPRGIVLFGSWMESAEGKALCDALKKKAFAKAVQCLPSALQEADDLRLRDKAREAGAAVVALVGAEGKARIFPLGRVEDPLTRGGFSLDVARVEDLSRTITLFDALARLAKPELGFAPAGVPCPSIGDGPLAPPRASRSRSRRWLPVSCTLLRPERASIRTSRGWNRSRSQRATSALRSCAPGCWRGARPTVLAASSGLWPRRTTERRSRWFTSRSTS